MEDLKRINLQLFAIGEDDDEPELDDEPEIDEPDNEPELNDEPELDDEPDEKVPLATFLEEKKRRKDIESQLRDLSDKATDADILHAKNDIINKFKDKGYDDDLGTLIAEEFVKLKSEMKNSQTGKTLDDEIQALSGDDFYSDAATYKNDLQKKVKEFKKKGVDISVKEAYNMLRGSVRAKEIQTEIEQKSLNSRRKSSNKKLPSAKSSKPTNAYPLDEQDKKALKGLQSMQPDMGWTEEKYFKTIKKKE